MNVNIDQYTEELKSLMNKLSDGAFDVSKKRPIKLTTWKKDLDDDDDFDFEENGKDSHREVDEKLKNILDNSSGQNEERLNKLKAKLMNESQSYYENNMNIFSNGMSLLSVNSLEMHGAWH